MRQLQWGDSLWAEASPEDNELRAEQCRIFPAIKARIELLIERFFKDYNEDQYSIAPGSAGYCYYLTFANTTLQEIMGLLGFTYSQQYLAYKHDKLDLTIDDVVWYNKAGYNKAFKTLWEIRAILDNRKVIESGYRETLIALCQYLCEERKEDAY